MSEKVPVLIWLRAGAVKGTFMALDVVYGSSVSVLKIEHTFERDFFGISGVARVCKHQHYIVLGVCHRAFKLEHQSSSPHY